MMIVIFFAAAVFNLTAREVIEIPLIETPPRIDGKLDDEEWSPAVQFRDFISYAPDFGKPASEPTVIYACSDRENFYFAVRGFQRYPSQIKGVVTQRDKIFGDDRVAIIIDTFYDFQSAYGFVVNALGIQGDGIIDADGNLDTSRDMVWYSKGIIDDKGYTVEIRVPFKSIRFPQKKKVKMGFWVTRNIVRTSEGLSFPEIFPNKGAYLSQSQPVLVKDMKYKQIIEILPAFTHSRSRSHEQGQWAGEIEHTDFSLTGKLGITPTLVLDAAYNPDFSQVEADAGQIDVNLRYALFYPEKRPFFLEGMEEFRFSGNTDMAPIYAIVHTRMIMNPIFGLKLSGKINKRDSLSTIFAIDEPLNDEGEPEGHRATFGIFRLRHAISKDTYIGGFYTGKAGLGGYNRVAGIDGRFRLSNSAIAEFHLMGSLTRESKEEDIVRGHALGLRYGYFSRKFLLEIGVQDISPDFRTDTGFLTRSGITRLGVFTMYSFYPKSKFFQRIEPLYWGYHLLDKESNLVESFNLFTLLFSMPGNSIFRLDLIMANEVFAGESFNTSGLGFEAASQITRYLYFRIWYRYSGSIYYEPGNPYGGRTNDATVSIVYQPTEKFSTSLDLTYRDFYHKSDSQKEFDYGILRSLTVFQANKYLSFRGIAEYNSYWKKLVLDFLASFTYIPGTVVHIGYGSAWEKTCWDVGRHEYIPTQHFLETRRAFFFKVSYLWRL
jgi:hypothetical protein